MGFYGSIFAREATNKGYKVLVIDKSNNMAGNIYTEKVEGNNVHKYGAHVFHTNNTEVRNYLRRFATFNRFTNSPLANYKGELYSLPFNMYTFNKMWGVVTPEEAEAKIEEHGNDLPKTIISREFSSEWKPGDELYYPINDEKNGKLYEEYKKRAEKEQNVIFGGRLGEYKYYDMDATVASVLEMCKRELV